MLKNEEKTMNQIITLCKGRGFVYPGSEIYGGLANAWDYGPLGVEFKNNVKKAWWKKFVQESPYNVGLDSAIIMNPQTWVTSGHVGGFSDPLMDCKDCKARYRADKLIEDAGGDPNGMTFEQMSAYIKEHGIACPDCGKKIALFGESRSEEAAARHGLDLLAEMPIDPKLASLVDAGKIEDFEGDWMSGVADAVEKLPNKVFEQ